MNEARNVINTETSHRNFLVGELKNLIEFKILPKLRKLVCEFGERGSVSCHYHSNSTGHLKDVLKYLDEKLIQFDSAKVNAILIMLRDMCYQCLHLKSMSLLHYTIMVENHLLNRMDNSQTIVASPAPTVPTRIILPNIAATTKKVVSDSAASRSIISENTTATNTPSRTEMFFKSALSITPPTPQIATAVPTPQAHPNMILQPMQPPSYPQTHMILQPMQPQANIAQPVAYQPHIPQEVTMNRRKRKDLDKLVYIPYQQPYKRNPDLTPSKIQVLENEGCSTSESVGRYADEIEEGINIDDGLALLA